MCGARAYPYGAPGERASTVKRRTRGQSESGENSSVRSEKKTNADTWAASPSAGDVLRARVEAGTVGGVWARVRACPCGACTPRYLYQF